MHADLRRVLHQFNGRLLLSWVGLTLMPALSATAQAQALDQLADSYWQAQLDRYPELATTNGFPGERNSRLTDLRPEAFVAYEGRLRELLRAAGALPTASLNNSERVNLAMLVESLTRDLSVSSCRRQLWEVNQQNGPQVGLLDLAQLQATNTSEERERLIQRWERIPAYLDQHVANLRAGLDSGLVAPRVTAERVIGQLDQLTASAPESSPLFAPPGRVKSPAERARLAAALLPLVRDSILPAFGRYRDFLRDELLPKSRTAPGISELSGGAACYRILIRAHTSLDLGAEEIHQTGLRELEKIRSEMLIITRRRFHSENLDSVLNALRSDPAMAYRTREQVLAAAQSAITRMEARLPSLFGRLPVRRVKVEPMPAYQEADAPSAYYYPGTADNSRPGRYLVNTFKPESRPRFTSEVLAFHEGVPGHHLQIALGQELPLPDFRRYGGGVTGFVEGWALYTERLADEAGVYSDDLARMGMLSFQSWRACRLVVDTGIHAFGWGRQEAIDYMLTNTALSRLDIESEVDRYIADPGQALGYMLGELEIFRLRDGAKAALRSKFDLKGFHDVVLADGSVTLPILRENVEHWVTKQGGKLP